ncbi:MAG: NYN domain-containing protein [Candidatus Heimdallarchaeota archaeon]
MEKKTTRRIEKPTVALFVDGPNMLRKEFMIDLRELKKRVHKYGRLIISKVFLNQFAPEKLIEAIINEGFEVVMVLAEQEEESNDVDVTMSVSAIETLLTKDIDVIAIATRDTDFLPVIQKAKEYGKRVVVLGAEPGFSASLRNAADYVENL